MLISAIIKMDSSPDGYFSANINMEFVKRERTMDKWEYLVVRTFGGVVMVVNARK